MAPSNTVIPDDPDDEPLWRDAGLIDTPEPAPTHFARREGDSASDETGKTYCGIDTLDVDTRDLCTGNPMDAERWASNRHAYYCSVCVDAILYHD